MKKLLFLFLTVMMLVAMSVPVYADSDNSTIGINLVLNQDITEAMVKQLGQFGKVNNVLYEINSVTMKIKSGDLEEVQALDFVAAANPDAERKGSPVDTIAVDTWDSGFSTWNLDVINVTDFGYDNRQVAYDGTGVYIAVLDTGLVDMWRQYFPEERIAEEYAISFGGGGGEMGIVSSQKNKWEHDTNSHGTHVTSTILGYSFLGDIPINGVAPNATVIPVKVLNQNGSGWSSVIAQGINYVTDLKLGPLKDYPVVINMSLGGPELDAIEQAAIDRAIEVGVILVASAGNEGEAGMGYPGAYEPVISVAASGWTGEWTETDWWTMRNWWLVADVPESVTADDFYITDFSSREYPGQDLDVAAPGSWVVGPYQLNSGQISYYFLGGTSMASPHVAGLVALMAQKDPCLTAAAAEMYLERSAMPMPAGTRTILNLNTGAWESVSWGDNASGAGVVDAIAALNMVP